TMQADLQRIKLAAQNNRQGKAWQKEFEIFKAKAALYVSVELEPENKAYREEYIWFLHLYGFKEELTEQLHALLLIDPQNKNRDTFYKILGWNLRDIGKFNESIHLFKHVYSIFPQSTIKDAYAQ